MKVCNNQHQLTRYKNQLSLQICVNVLQDYIVQLSFVCFLCIDHGFEGRYIIIPSSQCKELVFFYIFEWYWRNKINVVSKAFLSYFLFQNRSILTLVNVCWLSTFLSIVLICSISMMISVLYFCISGLAMISVSVSQWSRNMSAEKLPPTERRRDFLSNYRLCT